MSVPFVFLLFDALLVAGAYLLFGRNETAAISVLGFGAAMAIWQITLFSLLVAPTRTLRIEWKIRKPHVVQAVLQLAVYYYWGLYWGAPASQALYIVIQLICAYQLDLLFSLSRRKVAYAGFGPVPIVLSLNLFIWFRNDYFYMQLLMVALTYFAKEFFTWNRDGRRRHIFNPSAFSLTAAAVLLMLTASTDKLTTGVDLVESFELSPNFYEVIFLLGLVVQVLFETTAITFGAVIANFSLFFLVSWMLGGRAGPFPIDRSVFLAMTLLIPDPATTPKSAKGKFLFGVAYGAAIFASAIGLKYIQQPDYFNKILIIPVLNLLVPVFDRLARWAPFAVQMQHNAADDAARARKQRSRLAWIASYACLFVAIIGSLKRTRNTPLARPWLRPVAVASPEMNDLIFKMVYCRQVYPHMYHAFGFWNEILDYRAVKDVFGRELTMSDLQQAFGPEPNR